MIAQFKKALENCFDEGKIKKVDYFFEPWEEAIGFYFTYVAKGEKKRGYCCIYFNDLRYIQYKWNIWDDEEEFVFKMDEKFYKSSAIDQVSTIQAHISSNI